MAKVHVCTHYYKGICGHVSPVENVYSQLMKTCETKSCKTKCMHEGCGVKITKSHYLKFMKEVIKQYDLLIAKLYEKRGKTKKWSVI